MKRNQIIFFVIIYLAMALLSGCNQDCSNLGIKDTIHSDNSKITNLQSVIDMAKRNDVINLSDKKYKNITDFNAKINKELTIEKGDLKGATLTIEADGVVIKNLTNVSVVASSSTKIANSTLKDLKLGATSSRGTSNRIARPVVEIENTIIKEDIALNLEESIVIATNSSAKNLCFNANM